MSLSIQHLEFQYREKFFAWQNPEYVAPDGGFSVLCTAFYKYAAPNGARECHNWPASARLKRRRCDIFVVSEPNMTLKPRQGRHILDTKIEAHPFQSRRRTSLTGARGQTIQREYLNLSNYWASESLEILVMVKHKLFHQAGRITKIEHGD